MQGKFVLKKISEKRGDLYVMEENLKHTFKYKYFYLIEDFKEINDVDESFLLVVLRGELKINDCLVSKGDAIYANIRGDEINISNDFIGLIMSERNIESNKIFEIKNIPFHVKRIFFVDNMPVGALRGQHAHKIETEFLFVVQGEFRVFIKGAKTFERILKKGDSAISLPNAWTSVENRFDKGILLAFLSHKYDARGFFK